MSDKRTVRTLPRELLVTLSKELTDRGQIIEAGWLGLRIAAIPESAPEAQLVEMRRAFFAGAQHLFASMLAVMDEDREPTENDLRRMDLIDKELKRFVEAFEEAERQAHDEHRCGRWCWFCRDEAEQDSGGPRTKMKRRIEER